MSKKIFCLLLALLMLLTISYASAAEDIDGSSIAVVDEGDIQSAIDDAPLEIENDYADEEILSDSVDEEVLSDHTESTVIGGATADAKFHFEYEINDYGEFTLTTVANSSATGKAEINITDSSGRKQNFSGDLKDGPIVVGGTGFYLPKGNCQVDSHYYGDDTFFAKDYGAYFTVEKSVAELNLDSSVNDYGVIVIKADVNQTATGTFTFCLVPEGEEPDPSSYVNLTVYNGSASYDVTGPIDIGKYKIYVTYNGDDNYYKAHAEDSVDITKSYIDPKTESISVDHNTVNFTVDLGAPATGFVNTTTTSQSISMPINDGKANFTDVKLEGEYGDVSLVLIYGGDENYYGFYGYNVDFFIKYDPNLDVQAKVKYYEFIEVLANVNKSATGNISVTIRNSTGDVVLAGTEEIVNGSALYYELAQYDKGTYTIEVSYSGDDNFSDAQKTTSVELKTLPSMDYTVKVAGGEVTIAITMPSDINGNLSVLYPSGYVENVSIKNGSAKVYNVYMNETGDLAVTVSFAGNEKYYAINEIIGFVIKQSTLVKTSSSISVVYKNNAKITVKLTNMVTNKAIAGAAILITVNGKTYKGVTDKNGKAVITIPAKMIPKKYTARVTYKGTDRLESDIDEFKLTVKKASPKLTAKKKSFKKSKKIKKYTVTLKDNKGKAIKKAKLIIKVGKKKFTAKTNSKGKAVFKLKKLTKKAKYTAKITYKGNKYFKKVVKKAKIVIK